jgi:hypothetical protein
MSGGLETSVTAFRTGLLILARLRSRRTGNMARSDIRCWNGFPLTWGIWGFLCFLGWLMLVWTWICAAHSASNW